MTPILVRVNTLREIDYKLSFIVRPIDGEVFRELINHREKLLYIFIICV